MYSFYLALFIVSCMYFSCVCQSVSTSLLLMVIWLVSNFLLLNLFLKNRSILFSFGLRSMYFIYMLMVSTPKYLKTHNYLYFLH